MPSPVGHSMWGLAVAAGFWLPPCETWREMGRHVLRWWWLLPLVAVYANLPDLDFIPGMVYGEFNGWHHGYTHTMGWGVLVSVTTWLIWKAFDPRAGWRVFWFVLILNTVHLFADMITEDGRAPFGIMLCWPIADPFFIIPFPVYSGLRKATFGSLFQWYNLGVMAREFFVTLPILLAVLLYKRYTAGALWPTHLTRPVDDR